MWLGKRLKSFQYAFKGLFHLLRKEHNARIHLCVLLLVFLAGWYFEIKRYEWIAVLLCMALVMSLEAMNTAIERLTDLASPEYHPLAGQAKDVAAAAVLWAAIFAVIIGCYVFFPYVF